MADVSLKISVAGSGQVSAFWTVPKTTEAADLVFVYAPGAGSGLSDPFGAHLATTLASEGIATLRFQFPFMEAGRSTPDRNPVLEATWNAAIEAARERAPALVVGGRSMGGRIASQVVAEGADVAALALFAYPLHPVGRPANRRDEHLGAIDVPVLFCSGTRDAFAAPEELEASAAGMRASTFHFLVDADHGFNVPRAKGLSRNDIWSEACLALLSFLTTLDES
jgi:predicted alpha/beta-hydrolase family hydrolase